MLHVTIVVVDVQLCDKFNEKENEYERYPCRGCGKKTGDFQWGYNNRAVLQMVDSGSTQRISQR